MKGSDLKRSPETLTNPKKKKQKRWNRTAREEHTATKGNHKRKSTQTARKSQDTAGTRRNSNTHTQNFGKTGRPQVIHGLRTTTPGFARLAARMCGKRVSAPPWRSGRRRAAHRSQHKRESEGVLRTPGAEGKRTLGTPETKRGERDRFRKQKNAFRGKKRVFRRIYACV